MDITPITNTLLRLPLDAVILFSITLLFTIDTVRSGATRATSIAISAPLAVFLYSILPHTFFVGPFMEKLATPYLQAGVLGVLFVALFILIYRMMFGAGSGNISVTFALIATLATVSAVLAVWLQVPALQSIWHFGPYVQTIFGQTYTLYWLVLAYVLLAFIRS